MNFATWWDTTKGTATPETYAGWEESCRQAWHAALENSVLESARIAELEAERADFHVQYRVQCDAETKAQALRISELERQRDALQAEAQIAASVAKTNEDALRATLKQAREYETLYHELIMLVGNKYPNETRHETAKRYIASVEIPRSGQTGGQAAIGKVQP